MSRRLRIEYSGAIYHIMNRGDRKEAVFLDDTDRRRFLETIGEICVKTGWQIHAYCLMSNHFHLVVETPQPNLVAGMKWLLGTYSVRFNLRHRLSGHLFGGRYKSLIVGGQGGYLRSVGDYVHLNPARAAMIPEGTPLLDYLWSSFPSYLESPSKRPGWLRVDRILGECGIPKDSWAGRLQYEKWLERRRKEDLREEFVEVREGWCFADEQFRKELLEQVGKVQGPWHYGAEIHETAEAKANRILLEELRIRSWTEKDLEARKKGDSEKVGIAVRIRAETMVTLQWIADRLRMGARTSLAHLLYWKEKREQPRTDDQRKRAKAKIPVKVLKARTVATSEALGEDNSRNSTILLTDPKVANAEWFDVSYD